MTAALRGSTWAPAAAACAANTAAYAVVNTTPLVLGALLNDLALDETTAGGLVTVELLVMGFTALLVAPALRGSRKRRVAWCAGVIVAGAELATAAAATTTAAAACLAVLGLGTGLLLAAVNAIIASAAAPDRLFGVAFMAAYGLTAVLVFAMAPAIDAHGHAGAYVVLAAFTALLLPMLIALAPESAPIGAAERGRDHAARGALLLGGVAVISLAMMGFYAFIERLGAQAGLAPGTIATVFALQQVASVAGSALAGARGVRWGLLRTLLAATVLHTLAIVTAVLGSSPAAFALGVIGEGFTFLFMLPLLFTLAAEIDRSGRLAAAANGALMLATGVAPLVIGALIGRFGYSVIAWAMIAATPLGGFAFATARAARTPDA